MKIQLAEIAKALNGSVNMGGDKVITSVVFDSRETTPNFLFTPLAGIRDRYDFVSNTMADGAETALWGKGHEGKPTGVPVIEAEGPLTALQPLAKYYLGKVNPTAVGITDSNGRATTKDMVVAVLTKRSNAHKTQTDSNNEIGISVTILEMKPSTEILVFEMRMDRPEQLYRLSELVRPDICMIAIIGEAHIEFSGTRDRITDAKMEITGFSKEDGKSICNGGEPLLEEHAAKIKQDKNTFGFREEDIIFVTTFRPYVHHATLGVNDSGQQFKVLVTGKHNVSNALAAISIECHFDENYERVVQILANSIPIANRMQWRRGDVGEATMDDVYNSNSTAAKAATISLGQVTIRGDGHRIAVLGDMLEFGDESAELHAPLVNVLDPAIISELYLYGPEMRNLYSVLVDKYLATNLHYYPQDEMNHMIDDLRSDIKPDDIVMLKGPHGTHLEKVLDRLM